MLLLTHFCVTDQHTVVQNYVVESKLLRIFSLFTAKILKVEVKTFSLCCNYRFKSFSEYDPLTQSKINICKQLKLSQFVGRESICIFFFFLSITTDSL